VSPHAERQGAQACAGADNTLERVHIRQLFCRHHHLPEELECGLVLSGRSVGVDDRIPGDSVSVRHFVEQLAGKGQEATRGIKVDETVGNITVRGETELQDMGMDLGAFRESKMERAGPEDKGEGVIVRAYARGEHLEVETKSNVVLLLLIIAVVRADEGVVAEGVGNNRGKRRVVE